MKRLIFLILVMGTFCNVLAQNDTNWALQYKYWVDWDESTRDSAYIAPNSMITQKWYEVKKMNTDPDESYTFNANGTFTYVAEYNTEIPFKTTVKGTWKRNKQFLTIVFNYGTSVITPDKEKLSKLSLRKQDEFKTILNETLRGLKQMGTKTFSYQMLKLNKDALIISDKASTSATKHYVKQKGLYIAKKNNYSYD